jgi:hypothetical protein
LKIGDPDEAAAREAAAGFRSFMDEWGITLENMYRFAKKDWRPLVARAMGFWTESRGPSAALEPEFKRPKREREAWLAWREICDALEMIAVLRVQEPPEDDAYYREVYEKSSLLLKRLVDAGKYPKDLDDDDVFRAWRTSWDCRPRDE